MGLDQYLDKETYIGGHWGKVSGRCNLRVDDKPIKGIKVKRISTVMEAMGYWRKANAIHQWFIDNCAGESGDDCKPIYVGQDTLQKLNTLCKEVRKDWSKAEDLLPTQGGFFFGDLEYGDNYKQDINDTIAILDACKREGEHADFYYRASW